MYVDTRKLLRQPTNAKNGINLVVSYDIYFSYEIRIFYVNATAIVLRSNGRGQGGRTLPENCSRSLVNKWQYVAISSTEEEW